MIVIEKIKRTVRKQQQPLNIGLIHSEYDISLELMLRQYTAVIVRPCFVNQSRVVYKLMR